MNSWKRDHGRRAYVQGSAVRWCCSKAVNRETRSIRHATTLWPGHRFPVDVRKNFDPWALTRCCDYFYFLQDKQLTFQLLSSWVRSEPRERFKISLGWHATEQLAGWRGPISVTRKLIPIRKAGDKNNNNNSWRSHAIFHLKSSKYFTDVISIKTYVASITLPGL